MSAVLSLGDAGDVHRAGDVTCNVGWCGGNYPRPCKEPHCPGLVHASFGDEDWDGYWLYTKCDVCGESE